MTRCHWAFLLQLVKSTFLFPSGNGFFDVQRPQRSHGLRRGSGTYGCEELGSGRIESFSEMFSILVPRMALSRLVKTSSCCMTFWQSLRRLRAVTPGLSLMHRICGTARLAWLISKLEMHCEKCQKGI